MVSMRCFVVSLPIPCDKLLSPTIINRGHTHIIGMAKDDCDLKHSTLIKSPLRRGTTMCLIDAHSVHVNLVNLGYPTDVPTKSQTNRACSQIFLT